MNDLTCKNCLYFKDKKNYDEIETKYCTDVDSVGLCYCNPKTIQMTTPIMCRNFICKDTLKSHIEILKEYVK